MTSRQAKWINVKNMFALIIGIDDYKYIDGLKGAGADADAVAKFLKNHVKVQPSRIVNLRNKEATRAAIFQAFSDLWNNNLITYNDPILIYFAGHGCEMPRPDGWDTGGEDNIQGICPYDVEMKDSLNRKNFPIPDRTLGALLNKLSHSKGHCITVIFDCCHSASGVRAPGEDAERAKEFQGRLPGGIDKKYFRNFDKSVPLLNPQSRSYVFIAACGAKQKAREVNGRGKFTTAFLDALMGEGVDQLSFVDFMSSMKKIDQQDAQCEGHLKTRILFSNTLKLGWGVFPVSQGHRETYRIEAGLIHGVDKGSLFDIYETSAIVTTRDKPLLTLTARMVYPLHTIATIKEAGMRLPKTGYARQICRGNTLKVYFTSAFRAVAMIDHRLLLCPHDGRRKVAVEPDKNKADFIVDVKANNVVFVTNLKAVKDYGFRQLPKVIPVAAAPARIAHVLRAASQWTEQHSDIQTDSRWIDNIKLEFWSLRKIIDGEGVTVIEPKAKVPTMKKNTVFLRLNPDNGNLYGMVIRNPTRLDLHVCVVSFDIGKLEIEPYFSVAIGVEGKGNADPSLRAGNHLAIGYGNGGGTPFMFMPPEQNDAVEVTVLKLYFTTVAMDFGWLEQTSPFSEARDRGSVSKERVHQLMTSSKEPQGATALFTVVTYRAS